jgi:hypothetical protein
VTLVFESEMPIRRYVLLPRPEEFGGQVSETRFGTLTVIQAIATRAYRSPALPTAAP